ncbi:hypothetical protein N9L19_01210 [bacterium]|nr:hypothetical protein [bacterium]
MFTVPRGHLEKVRREKRKERTEKRYLNNSNSTDRVCTGSAPRREDGIEQREERREKRET